MARKTRSNRGSRVRAYRVGHRANPGKVAAVGEILPHWRRGLVHVQLLQTRAYKEHGFVGLMDTKGLPGYLSQRQWKSVVSATRGRSIQVEKALREEGIGLIL
ncbi:hypothetical protein [Actinomadura sp. 6N118]|uniref:hypothetical protein n=1 Tax=Actinomadura sp. 6N118 TaxID=3375151 RepID=UPI0037A7D98F